MTSDRWRSFYMENFSHGINQDTTSKHEDFAWFPRVHTAWQMLSVRKKTANAWVNVGKIVTNSQWGRHAHHKMAGSPTKHHHITHYFVFLIEISCLSIIDMSLNPICILQVKNELQQNQQMSQFQNVFSQHAHKRNFSKHVHLRNNRIISYCFITL